MAKLSLQEQMLKAGLVNQKKLKKAKKNSKKSRDLSKEVKATVQAKKEQEIQKAKALNQLKKDELLSKEIKAQVTQLVNMNKIDVKHGDIKYNFTHNNVIKYIYVTEDIRKQLLNGLLAVALLDNNFLIIPSSVANKIMQRDDSVVIDIKSLSEESQDDDDPYADYVVPDDLMW